MPRPDEKVERNRAIIEAYLKRVDCLTIARTHDISLNRVHDIVNRYKLKVVRYGTK